MNASHHTPVQDIVAAVEARREPYIAMADRIWGLAEMRYQEFQSAEIHAAALEAEGFRVQRGVAGMPTAFVAEAGQGGPVIGFLGEYDALAGLSQASGALTCTPDPGRPGSEGHGCGHHLLGTAAHLAAVVARDQLRRQGRAGTIRFYGCPAEEAAAGKTFMARAGLFDDLDAALSWHPGVANSVFMNATLANVQAYFRFHGKSAHAAVAPHLGRSALDAAELMNIGVNYLREHMVDQARVHFAYMHAGGPSTNVIPAYAELLYTVRSPHVDDALALFERVEQVARGAALMTGTRVEVVFDKAVSNVLHNDTLDAVMAEQLQAIGALQVTDDEFAFASRVQQTLSDEELASSGKHFGAALRNPSSVVPGILPYEPLAPRPMTGSTDMGDVSWAVPTTQCLTACFAWGTAFHSWQMVSQGKQSLAHKGMLLAAQALAATGLALMDRPQVLKQAAEELNSRRGGKPYRCPIPPDILPPPQRQAS